MASYKLIVKNAKVILKTVTNSVLNITGIRDLLTGSGSVDSNTKIDWTLQHYTNTAANFTSTNPILLVGQVGIETDDLLTAPKYKIGDGVTAWNTLPYNSSGGGGLSGLTTNKVLKATSSTTAGDSNITDDGTTVGIVTGNSQIYALPTEAGFYYFENNTGIVKVNDSGTYLQHDDLIDLNAPSVTKNGIEVATVNDVDLKLNIEATQTTGASLTFLTDSVYGSIATPETGNITYSATSAKVGVTNIIIHNHSIAPTFGTNMKKLSGSGTYVVSVVNYIFVTYINSTEVIYSISQRT